MLLSPMHLVDLSGHQTLPHNIMESELECSHSAGNTSL